jgi:hypothetical protein
MILSAIELLTMKFCCKGTQLYMVGIGLTALMILIGMDWILPSYKNRSLVYNMFDIKNTALM